MTKTIAAAFLGCLPAIQSTPNLPCGPAANHELAMRAVATLLAASGSEIKWGGRTANDDDIQEEPLRFSLVKKVAWAGHYWAGGNYLVLDHPDDEPHADAAAQQVARLVARLADSATLIEFGPEERALF